MNDSESAVRQFAHLKRVIAFMEHSLGSGV